MFFHVQCAKFQCLQKYFVRLHFFKNETLETHDFDSSPHFNILCNASIATNNTFGLFDSNNDRSGGTTPVWTKYCI